MPPSEFAGRRSTPPPEGFSKVGLRRIGQRVGDIANRKLRELKQLTRHDMPRLVEERLKCRALAHQMSR